MAQNWFNDTWGHAPAFMPTANGAWAQAMPRPAVRPVATGYGGPRYNAYSRGNVGRLSSGQIYTPATVGRIPVGPPPIVRQDPRNFGSGNGPGEYGGGGYGGGGCYGGGDPF